MKAIILAAGYATRMYPLTENQSKCLLPIGNKKVLNYVVEKLMEVKEVDEIFVVSNDKFYQDFVNWKNMQNYAIKITILNDNTKSNEDRLGTVGDLLFVMDKYKIEDWCYAIAGDNLFGFNLNKMREFSKQKNTTIVGARNSNIKEIKNTYGCIEVKGTKIISFEEKPEEPKSKLASTACYLFSPKDIKYLKKKFKLNNCPDHSGDLIKELSENSEVNVVVYDDFWYDIGSLEEYKNVRERYG